MKGSSWISLVLFGLAYASTQDLSKLPIDFPSWRPNNPPIVRTPPSTEMQQLVAPMVGKVTDPADASKVAGFFRDFAEIIRRDTDQITSMIQFRTAMRASLELAFEKTPLQGKYSLSKIANPIAAQAVTGTLVYEPVALDADKRKRLADVLDAMAWAVESG